MVKIRPILHVSSSPDVVTFLYTTFATLIGLVITGVSLILFFLTHPIANQLMLLGVIGYVGFTFLVLAVVLWQRILRKNPQVILDKSGLFICQQKLLIDWDDVVSITHTSRSTKGFSVDFVHFCLTNCKGKYPTIKRKWWSPSVLQAVTHTEKTVISIRIDGLAMSAQKLRILIDDYQQHHQHVNEFQIEEHVETRGHWWLRWSIPCLLYGWGFWLISK
jgi:hypothetical protein